jgi:hypothetical protein
MLQDFPTNLYEKRQFAEDRADSEEEAQTLGPDDRARIPD